MKNCFHFDKINSTSTYLKENYDKHDNLTFISADYQECGHGRYNRVWVSKEKEDLLFSILIKDKVLINKYADLSLASAACVYEIIKQLGINNASIKWPNDIFVNDKKISGILLESISFSNEIKALVLGIGINVNSSIFPENLINNTTSIYLEKGKVISIEDLKELVYSKLLKMFKDIKDNTKEYIDTVRSNNYLKGKTVYATINNKKTSVHVLDINKDNSLKVKMNEEIIDVYSGEISFHV